MVRRHLVITGHVQGVNFRFETYRTARSLGAVGWVRNQPDGTVEAEVEGPDDVVDQVVAWCQDGPSAAVVESVEVTDVSPLGETSFEIQG